MRVGVEGREEWARILLAYSCSDSYSYQVVLPAWLSWSDLTEMQGMEGLDRHVLARLFARSLNGKECYQDETVANAERQVG